MSADLEQLGAGIILATEALEPFRAAAKYGRNDRNALDIVDGGWAAIEADRRRKRRLLFLRSRVLFRLVLFARTLAAPVI